MVRFTDWRGRWIMHHFLEGLVFSLHKNFTFTVIHMAVNYWLIFFLVGFRVWCFWSVDLFRFTSEDCTDVCVCACVYMRKRRDCVCSCLYLFCSGGVAGFDVTHYGVSHHSHIETASSLLAHSYSKWATGWFFCFLFSPVEGCGKEALCTTT